jgi:hypothetical protein
MPIKVVHDGTGRGDPRENCAFCRAGTRYWFAKKDVAVCPACALDHTASEVPSTRPLGHRYSTAVSHLEQKDQLERLQTKTLNEIAELELAEML